MGQEYWGRIFDSVGSPVKGATILLMDSSRSITMVSDTSDESGNFRIGLPRGYAKYSLTMEARHIECGIYRSVLVPGDQRWEKGFVFYLQADPELLNPVVISRTRRFNNMPDTLFFDADRFLSADVRKVEDLLRRIPDFTSDAQGQLFYRGKRVEQVMIDGVDLAGSTYQLITRSLTAQKVSRVEVIQNFSENRVLQAVSSSGKVAINLKIAANTGTGLSGAIDAGIADADRWIYQVNALYNRQHFKSLATFSGNSVARDQSLSEEGGGIDQEQNALQLPREVLNTGKPDMPAIGLNYVRNNRDFGGAFMSSWNWRQFVKCNALVNFQDYHNDNLFSASQRFNLPGQDVWLNEQQMGFVQRLKSVQAKLKVKFERSVKVESAFVIQFGQLPREQGFNQMQEGSIVDSLVEVLHSKPRFLQFNGYHSRVLGNGVLHLQLDGLAGNMNQHMDIQTNRLVSYFPLVPQTPWFFQQYLRSTGSWAFKVKYLGKTRYMQYAFGLSYKQDQLSHATLTGRRDAARKEITAVLARFSAFQRIKDAAVISSNRISLGRRIYLLADGKAGIKQLLTEKTSSVFLDWDFQMGVQVDLAAFRRLQFQAEGRGGFGDWLSLHPSGILSGNGQVLDGLQWGGLEKQVGARLTYSAHDMKRQGRRMVNLGMIWQPAFYGSNLQIKPSYSISYLQLMQSKSSVHAVWLEEHYLYKLKGKLGMQIDARRTIFPFILNNNKRKILQQSLVCEGWWATGFDIPVNIEFRGKYFLTVSGWQAGESTAVRQFQHMVKAKLSLGKRFYSVVMWNRYRLSPTDKLDALDFAIHIRSKGRWAWHIEGVNLLNVQQVSLRSVEPYMQSGITFPLNRRYVLWQMTLQL